MESVSCEMRCQNCPQIEIHTTCQKSLSDDGLLQVMLLKRLPSLKLAPEAVGIEDEFPLGKATGRRYSVQCTVLLSILDF